MSRLPSAAAAQFDYAVELLASLAGRYPAPASWLSPSEAERVEHLRAAGRRDQYLAGHWLARELVARRLHCPPERVALCERRSRPPAVAGGNDELCISLSHSGDWIAAAVAGQPIGIDIEQRRPRPALQQFEALLLADSDPPGTLSNDQLLARWVAKEAYIKQQQGSALPETLRALQLRRTTAGSANVRVYSSSDLHFGIALDGPIESIPAFGADGVAVEYWAAELTAREHASCV